MVAMRTICSRSACESPQSAKDLLSAAKMWKKMHAIINVMSRITMIMRMMIMIIVMMMIMMINYSKNYCDDYDDVDDDKTKAVPYSDKYTELVEAVYSAVRFSYN